MFLGLHSRTCTKTTSPLESNTIAATTTTTTLKPTTRNPTTVHIPATTKQTLKIPVEKQVFPSTTTTATTRKSTSTEHTLLPTTKSLPSPVEKKLVYLLPPTEPKLRLNPTPQFVVEILTPPTIEKRTRKSLTHTLPTSTYSTVTRRLSKRTTTSSPVAVIIKMLSFTTPKIEKTSTTPTSRIIISQNKHTSPTPAATVISARTPVTQISTTSTTISPSDARDEYDQPTKSTTVASTSAVLWPSPLSTRTIQTPKMIDITTIVSTHTTATTSTSGLSSDVQLVYVHPSNKPIKTVTNAPLITSIRSTKRPTTTNTRTPKTTNKNTRVRTTTTLPPVVSTPVTISNLSDAQIVYPSNKPIKISTTIAPLFTSTKKPTTTNTQTPTTTNKNTRARKTTTLSPVVSIVYDHPSTRPIKLSATTTLYTTNTRTPTTTIKNTRARTATTTVSTPVTTTTTRDTQIVYDHPLNRSIKLSATTTTVPTTNTRSPKLSTTQTPKMTTLKRNTEIALSPKASKPWMER